MTQRNNFQPDPPLHPDAFAAGTAVSAVPGSGGVGARGSRMRRAARITVTLPVEIRDQFGRREETRTHSVTVRGAVFETFADFRVGHRLTLKNVKSGRSAECYVSAVEATVRDQHEVEVEFTAPQPDFWPVQFPTEDNSHVTYAADKSLPISAFSAVSDEVERFGSSSISAESFSHSKKDDGIVALAHPVAHSSNSGTQNRHQTFTSKAVGMDTVAQFRAANRAAHRREQRKRTLYSLVTILALAGSVYGGRVLFMHRGDDTEQTAAALVPTPRNTLRLVPLDAKTPTPVPDPPSSQFSSLPQRRNITPVARPNLGLQARPAIDEAPAAPVESDDTQVEVRHSVPLASARPIATPDVGEEPMALPLRVPEGPNAGTKPELLSSLAASPLPKPAVLAPQVPKKVVPARLVYTVPAQYPAMARQVHAEGEVLLSLDVDASGNVSSAKALSGAPLLRAAAVDAVRKWKYQPATLGDKPVPSTETVKIDFHLR